ncbi:SAM-dependent methyltransferase [Acrocarpospora corrugata]|uniref:SAM-dependent methyltransferase n=1 Tax=Acrocarpospora corrugata TaxID=35763 RepID=A0A5M3VTS9_9ACTN|nr:methyltransferase [Acrocarpospora corrugata]GER99628.1 SAM-dependent methyltransferase [Acrocarpospora corrugata]
MPLDLPPDEAARFHTTGEAPAALLDLVGSMANQAAVTALRLGVFPMLCAKPYKAAEVADSLNADQDGLELLLAFLTTAGYLTCDAEGRYFVLPTTKAWLGTGYGTALRLWSAIVSEYWSDLAESIACGPRADFYTWLGDRPFELGLFQSLQRGLAEWMIPEVLNLASVPENARNLLDVGGGHGWYATAFRDRHPTLTATIADLPSALDPYGENPTHPIDLANPDFSGLSPDVILLFNVLHGFPAHQAETIVHTAVRALQPGGVIHILETTSQPRGGVAEAAFTDGFALNLWLTQGGRLHPTEELSGWLMKAGCADVRITELERSASHTLLSASPVPPDPR